MRPTSTFTAALASLATVTLLGLAASEARAQQLKLAADVDVASGLEGGSYKGMLGLRRARTTLRFGADAYTDEFPDNGIAAGLLLEMEPHIAVGADVRYQRLLGKHFALELGFTGFFAPATLFGASAGALYRQPIIPRLWFTVGPTVTGYFLGSDLPAGTVVWQVLLRGGLHVDL